LLSMSQEAAALAGGTSRTFAPHAKIAAVTPVGNLSLAAHAH
jgi:hypothetical protein